MTIILGGIQDPSPDPTVSVRTGPFSREVHLSKFYKKMTWYRRKPIRRDIPNPFGIDCYGQLSSNFNDGGNWSGWSYGADWNGVLCQQAIARARGRFNEQLGSNAGLGVDLVEWGQSLNMIETRTRQLIAFVSAARKGRWNKAADALWDRRKSKPAVPKGLAKGKGFANNFLEWHFGWSPLISDIYDAIKVLESPLSTQWVRARANVKSNRSVRGRFDDVVQQWTDYTDKYTCELGARIYVSNPNLRLASQLGLVNPANLAWEVVPFSFVVDWFVPVGNFLSQWTDFAGLTLNGAYTTLTWYHTRSGNYYLNPIYGDRNESSSDFRFGLTREPGISSYRLTANRFSGFSAVRGATAISLLLQGLKGPGGQGLIRDFK